jgi:glycosyltransferase involved in cell wall biosynthesis
VTSAFFLYRDSPLRRAALGAPPGARERYALYGLDEVATSGLAVRHSLEPGLVPGRGARALDRIARRMVDAYGGYGGDFATVLASRRSIANAGVVFSTVDTVGIPLALLARVGVVRTPIVYASIGLPERLAQLRSDRARRLYRDSWSRLAAIVAYGWGEVEALRAWLGDDAGKLVQFLPFGVDTNAFRPEPEREPEWDVVSVGADPHRDFGLLSELARRLPERSFRVVASRDNAPSLERLPSNLTVEADVSLTTVRDRLAAGRVVVLPVKDNTYSGATTVLLQAMALGKPIVVTRTAAIARGYSLEDGLNVAFAPPGDIDALDARTSALLADPNLATAMGARARETVERELTWQRYADGIRALLLEAANGSSVAA